LTPNPACSTPLAGRRRARGGLALGLAVTLAATLAAACSEGDEPQRGLVIGKSSTTTEPAPAPTIPPPPPTTTAARPSTTGAPAAVPAGRPGWIPDGAPYGPAIPFSSAVAVPQDLVFVLAIGSDARPGRDPRRANADSLHLLAVDPVTGSGTVLGFPRDSWVQIPGRGTGKINSALALGGPELMAKTIRHLTGLPVHYWVLTGFAGFERIVNDLGGVNVQVNRRMRDRPSGANFDVGWHHMTGRQALAYSRNRKDVENGDFSRSLHQGKVVLAALSKLRAEVGDDAGLAGWIGVLLKHAKLDTPLPQLTELAVLARNLDPARITNVVVPGRVGWAGRQSVVFLKPEAEKIFVDLRPDAVIGGPSGNQPRPASAPLSAQPPPPPPPEAQPGPSLRPAPATTTTTSTAPPPSVPPVDPLGP
ncbi:MAG: LCP family protein, partial [Acidimicrobiia bacterium]